MIRRGDRVVEGTGLENRRRETYRGFESHPLRHYSDVAQLAEQVAVNHRVVGSNPTVGAIQRGFSSDGRAPALHAGDHRFDPGKLHYFNVRILCIKQ